MTHKTFIKLRDLKELQSSQKQKAELDEFITPFKVKKPRKSRTAKKTQDVTTTTPPEINEENDKKEQQVSTVKNIASATPAKTPATSNRRRISKSAKKELPPNQMLISAFYKSCEKSYKIEPLKEEVNDEPPPTPIGNRNRAMKVNNTEQQQESVTVTKRSSSSSRRKTSKPPKTTTTMPKNGRKRLFVDDEMEERQKDDVKSSKITIRTEPNECINLISDNEEDKEDEEEENMQQVEPNIDKELINTNLKENLEIPPNEILNSSLVNEPVTPLATNPSKPNSSQSIASVRSSTTSKRKPKPCPPYKIVEDTNFAVDAFQYGYIENVTHYFLTHFHADHYIGLTRKFSKPLYMSKITACLVRHFIPLENEYIHEIDLNVPITVDGVEIVALDANHCPGAIMLLFKVPYKEEYKYILHTGDFRAWHEMESEPLFWNHQIHTIYLDTTYISNKYAFCTQYESITRAKDMIEQFREKHKEKKILFVCGSYVIGKEKFWSAIAEEYQLKVWTENNRKKALKAMAIEEYNKWLVDDPHTADMHILAMGKISYLHLVEHFTSYENEYDILLALRPSGWEKDSKPQYRGKINIIGIEYSEHSSYEEMRRFIRFLKPHNVISTVPVGRDLMLTGNVPEKWYKYDKLQHSSNYQPRLDEYMGKTPKRKNINSKSSIRLPNAEMGGVERFVSPLKKKNTKEINNNNNQMENENKEDDKDTIVSIKSSEVTVERVKINKTKNSIIENQKKPKMELISPGQQENLIKNYELKEGEMCSIFIENISHHNSSDLFESPSLKENKNISSKNTINDKKKKTLSQNSSDNFEPKLSKTKKRRTPSSRKKTSEDIPISQKRRRTTRQMSKGENKSDVPSTISEGELVRQIKIMEENQNTMKSIEKDLSDIKDSQINPLLKSNTNTNTNTSSSLCSAALEEEKEESIYYKTTNELKLDLIMDDNKSELVSASQTTMDLLSTPRPLRNRINYYSISQNLTENISNATEANTSSTPLKNSMKYAFRWQQEDNSPNNAADAGDIIPASQTSKDLANTPRPIRNKKSRPSKSSRQNSLRLEKISEENNEIINLCDISSIDYQKSNFASDKESSIRNFTSRLSSCSSQSQQNLQSSNDSKRIYNISQIVKSAVNALSQKEPDTSVDHIPPELLSPIELDADDDWI